MRGEYDCIKEFPFAAGGAHPGTCRGLFNGDNRITHPRGSQHGEDLVDVGAGSPVDGEPWVMCGDAKEAVVVEEVEKG